jgi:hypothetical protein
MHARPRWFAIAPFAAPLTLGLATLLEAQAPAAASSPSKAPAVIKPGDNLVAEGLPEIPA